MINSFRARNYGCLLDVTASLTPLHAFIGPNDSGKSTLLHGMRTLVQLVAGGFEVDKKGLWRPFDPFLTAPSAPNVELGCSVEGVSYLIWRNGEEFIESIESDEVASKAERLLGERLKAASKARTRLVAELRAARLVRFDPDALREPHGLIPETAPVSFLDDRGHGLAGVYFAIKNRDDDTFAAIVEGVRHHFPTIRNIRVKAVTSSEVILEAILASGEHIEARRLSEGLLYYLAFAALQHLDPVSILLVEEPENGLHPARIAEVVKVLRTLAESGTQILLATHSPLIVNELHPDEVSVVTRTADKGTQVTPIADTPSFELRTKAYALGELWLSYADGIDEGPLLAGGPRP